MGVIRWRVNPKPGQYNPWTRVHVISVSKAKTAGVNRMTVCGLVVPADAYLEENQGEVPIGSPCCKRCDTSPSYIAGLPR